MKSIDRRFDAIVIGSGAGGSIAVKELTERGMDVLLLEAGRDLTEADFVPPPPKPPRQLGMDLHLRAKAALAGQHVQARRTFFSETSNRFLVNDRENPYSTPSDAPYLWIRGRILGGRLNSYGRVLQRMSDVDFKAASRDGHGEDWPISYADLEPWYDQDRGVHRRLRQRGRDRAPAGRQVRRPREAVRRRAGVQGEGRGAVARSKGDLVALRGAEPRPRAARDRGGARDRPPDDAHGRGRQPDHRRRPHGARRRRGVRRPRDEARAPRLRGRRPALRVDDRVASADAELRLRQAPERASATPPGCSAGTSWTRP